MPFALSPRTAGNPLKACFWPFYCVVGLNFTGMLGPGGRLLFWHVSCELKRREDGFGLLFYGMKKVVCPE